MDPTIFDKAVDRHMAPGGPPAEMPPGEEVPPDEDPMPTLEELYAVATTEEKEVLADLCRHLGHPVPGEQAQPSPVEGVDAEPPVV
jgi:hypothetical protein